MLFSPRFSLTFLLGIFLVLGSQWLGCSTVPDPPTPTGEPPLQRPVVRHVPEVEPEVVPSIPTLGVRLESFTGALRIQVRFPSQAILTVGEQTYALTNADGAPLSSLYVAARSEGINVGGRTFDTNRVQLACADQTAETRVTIVRDDGNGEAPVEQEIIGELIVTIPIDVTDPGLWVIARVSLEEYVRGALLGEMPARFHPEALKAQAVAIRTYGLYQVLTNQARGAQAWSYDVVDSVSDLRYLGPSGHTPETDAIVADTHGQVMVYQGTDDTEPRLFLPYFHSTCGGATTDAYSVHGTFRGLPPLAGAHVDACGHSPVATWSTTLPWAQVREKLIAREVATDALGETLTAVRGEDIDASGRPRTIVLETEDGAGLTLPSARFRLIVGAGRDALPSTLATFSVENNEIHCDGHGWGHGVGMCQYGADGLGQEGKTWQEILAAYYPQSVLVAYYE